jgi:hypothetical protein
MESKRRKIFQTKSNGALIESKRRKIFLSTQTQTYHGQDLNCFYYYTNIHKPYYKIASRKQRSSISHEWWTHYHPRPLRGKFSPHPCVWSSTVIETQQHLIELYKSMTWLNLERKKEYRRSEKSKRPKMCLNRIPGIVQEIGRPKFF